MRLNNRGWGIKEMLILSAVLIFFFCLAIYFIYLLYSSLSLNLKDNSICIEVLQYEALEDKLEEAADKYIEDINQSFNSTVIVYANDLVDAGYIDDIRDPNTDNLCSGYVVVENTNIKAYIKCDKYKTSGYEE